MPFAQSTKRIKRYDDFAHRHNKNSTPFNEQRFTEKTQQFILNSNLPLSNERDSITETNNGTVTKVDAEYRLRATTDANSFARLQSEQRGVYISGNLSEAGIGVRIPTQPTGDAYARWGYYRGTEGVDLVGFFFQYDADGISVCVARDGSITQQVYQQHWNISDVDNNIDGRFDIENGAVFQINFVYYGYGPITFEIGAPQFDDTRYSMIPCHLIKIDGTTSIDEPNLPLTVDVDSGTSGTQLDVFVGGRQFSTYGKSIPISRSTAWYRLLQTGIGTTFLPTVSVRYKTGFKNIQSILSVAQVVSADNMVIQIVRNPTLTGASFTTPTGYDADEIATEWDISATSFTGGQAIFTAITAGGNQATITERSLPDRPIYEDDIVTLAIRAFTGTNKTASTLLEIAEKW